MRRRKKKNAGFHGDASTENHSSGGGVPGALCKRWCAIMLFRRF